jgi:hypothetical protein
MNALYNRLFNGLPNGTCPPIGKIQFTSSQVDDSHPQVVKMLPSGQMIGLYRNATNSFLFARNGTNGAGGIGFCITQYGAPCPLLGTEITPDVFILPGQAIFALQGQTRWIPVRTEDEHLLFSPQHGLAAVNPLTTAPPAGLSIETLTETLTNATPAMKVAAAVAVVALGWYLLK